MNDETKLNQQNETVDSAAAAETPDVVAAAPESESTPAESAPAPRSFPGLAKARGIFHKLVFIPVLVLFALQIYLTTLVNQGVGYILDFPMTTDSLTRITKNLMDIFESGDVALILSAVITIIFMVILAIFSLIVGIRTIILFFKFFGFLKKGMEPEKIEMKFASFAGGVLVSYGLILEMVFLAQLTNDSFAPAGKSAIVTAGILFVALAAFWQFMAAKEPDQFNWKQDCLTFAHKVIMLGISLMLPITLAAPSIREYYLMISDAIATDRGVDPASAMIGAGQMALDVAIIIVACVTLRKVLKFGSVPSKPGKTPEKSMFSAAIALLVLMIARAAASAALPLINGDGFDASVLSAELLGARLVPMLLCVAAIVFAKVATPSAKKE